MFEVLLANGSIKKASTVSLQPAGVLYLYDQTDDGRRTGFMVLGPTAWLSYREKREPVIDPTPFVASEDDLADDVVVWAV